MEDRILWWSPAQWTAVGTLAAAIATIALAVLTMILLKATRRATEAAERSAASSEAAAQASLLAAQIAEAGLDIRFSAEYRQFKDEEPGDIKVVCEGVRVWLRGVRLHWAVFYDTKARKAVTLEEVDLNSSANQPLPAELHSGEMFHFNDVFGPIDPTNVFKAWAFIDYSVTQDGELHDVSVDVQPDEKLRRQFSDYRQSLQPDT